ncbi:MAG: hypothetical protein PVH18_01855 [Chloroflexota bacterium]|jgi:uncharacterized membrane protein
MSDDYQEATTASADISDDDRLWAALAWIPISPLWPIIAVVLLLMPEKRERPFINYHAILALITGVVGILLSFLCVGVIILLAMFYYAFKAYQGERVNIPVLTDFAESQGWI